jgi:myo-inositol-1(or 4)-monophosphatase
MPSPSPAPDDLALLREAARACGPLLRETFGADMQIWSKGAAGPVTEIDLRVNAQLKERLLGARPDYGWLSEESADNPARLHCAALFVVDPIDGTSAFIAGQPEFCVALAVVRAGQPESAAIYNPITEEMFEARKGAGAFLNGAPIRVSARAALEDSRLIGRPNWFKSPRWPAPWPPVRAEHRVAMQYRLALVAAGAFDGMMGLGAKADWDVAAGALLVAEAGGIVTTPWNEPLAFNRPEPLNPGVVAAGPALHPLLIERVQSLPRPGAPRAGTG